MTEPLFVGQAKLERWIDDGEVTFEDNVLTIRAQQRSYRLAPAVRVSSLIDGKDTHGLVGRVVTVAELEALGAEHFQGSVILGDTGYECEEGFVGTEQAGPTTSAPVPRPPAAAATAPTAKPGAGQSPSAAPAKVSAAPPTTARAPSPPAPVPSPAAGAPPAPTAPDDKTDMDLLTDFLLKHL